MDENCELLKIDLVHLEGYANEVYSTFQELQIPFSPFI